MARSVDVIVVGAGIAGLSAALAGRQEGSEILLLEKASKERRGGNTRFSDAQIRYPHTPDVYCAKGYTAEAFHRDLMKVSSGRADEELVDVLVQEAAPTVNWLTELGVRWEKGFPHPSSYRRRPVDGGAGLVKALFDRAEELGVAISYETAADVLLTDKRTAVSGARLRSRHGYEEVYARNGVVLACGGFQANVEMRAKYLGAGSENLILRGSRYNTGEGLRMALAIGAQPAGQWTDFHSAMIDARSPQTETGVMAIYIYQLGIIVNREGKRFLDEGEDYRDHTYVKFSKRVLRENGGVAFAIFDQKIRDRTEDWQRGVRTPFEPVVAETLEGLAERLSVEREAFVSTVRAFNAAVQPGTFDPAIKDRKATIGIEPQKSNWAQPIDTPPYVGFPVTGGITFTFGGLKVDRHARVLSTQGWEIPRLYAAGETVGGLYYGNYPGATSVLRGAVFGRIAGRHAASQGTPEQDK